MNDVSAHTRSLILTVRVSGWRTFPLVQVVLPFTDFPDLFIAITVLRVTGWPGGIIGRVPVLSNVNWIVGVLLALLSSAARSFIFQVIFIIVLSGSPVAYGTLGWH